MKVRPSGRIWTAALVLVLSQPGVADVAAAQSRIAPRDGTGNAPARDPDLQGEPWCSEKTGCARWWSLFTVSIVGEDITIRYRGTQFAVFKGRIRLSGGSGKEAGGNITGYYTPPPESCSEAGRRLSDDEAKRFLDRQDARDRRRRYDERSESGRKAAAAQSEPVIAEAEVLRRVRSPDEWEKRSHRPRNTDDKVHPATATLAGRSRSNDEIAQQKARQSASPQPRDRKIEVEAREPLPTPKVEGSRDPDTNARGRFVRALTGKISPDRNTITLQLPSLPILDHKCAVTKQTEPGELVLVRQDAPYAKRAPETRNPDTAQAPEVSK